MPKTIMIDLDGVLNDYDGNYNENEIAPLREGAREFLEELAKDYEIEIFTVRNKKLTIEWLRNNNLLDLIKDVTNVKNPYASIFIDDRGINFSGNYKKTLSLIKEFKPHWK